MGEAVAIRTAKGFRCREARRPVNLDARMRTERGWSDITIRNLSSGGFMAQTHMPPRRGYYVEVWRGEVCIVGYVVWSTGSRFGARSQATIDLPALIAKRATAIRGTERRRKDRRPYSPSPSPQAQAARARQIGRTVEFVVLGAAVAAAALLLAGVVSDVLTRPFAAIRGNLMDVSARGTN